MTTPLPENCVPLLQQAAELGLKIEVKDSRTLTVEPADRCPPEFADALRIHKWHLLAVLTWPFVMVNSQTLEQTVFLCEDDTTKAALIEAGTAEEFSDLHSRRLARSYANTIALRLSRADELCKIHEIKKTLNARISPQ